MLIDQTLQTFTPLERIVTSRRVQIFMMSPCSDCVDLECFRECPLLAQWLGENSSYGLFER